MAKTLRGPINKKERDGKKANGVPQSGQHLAIKYFVELLITTTTTGANAAATNTNRQFCAYSSSSSSIIRK